MLTSHRSLISPSCKRRCVSSHIHTNRQLNVACSAEDSNNKRTGWHWPFSKNTAGDDIETEIVYVTDTAEADEVIEEPEYVDDVEQVQLGDQIGAGAAAVAAEDGDVLQQEQLPGQASAPVYAEPAATQVRFGKPRGCPWCFQCPLQGHQQQHNVTGMACHNEGMPTTARAAQH